MKVGQPQFTFLRELLRRRTGVVIDHADPASMTLHTNTGAVRGDDGRAAAQEFAGKCDVSGVSGVERAERGHVVGVPA